MTDKESNYDIALVDGKSGGTWDDPDYEYKCSKILSLIEKEYPDDYKMQGSIILTLLSLFNSNRVEKSIQMDEKDMELDDILDSLYAFAEVLASNIKITLQQATELKKWIDGHPNSK